jgi:hypothetical protein
MPQNVPEHMKLMLDLICSPFRMDKTSASTLMLNEDLSQMTFKFLPARFGDRDRRLTAWLSDGS